MSPRFVAIAAVWALYVLVAAWVWFHDWWKPEHPVWRKPSLRDTLEKAGPLADGIVAGTRAICASFWPVIVLLAIRPRRRDEGR